MLVPITSVEMGCSWGIILFYYFRREVVVESDWVCVVECLTVAFL